MEFTYTDSLKNEVPKEIRLEVYKRAKNLIENWIEERRNDFGLYNPNLCLLLPCILYNTPNYLCNGSCEEIWYCHYTVMGFSEFTNEHIKLIENSNTPNLLRLELLTNWIEQLNQ